MSPSLPRFTPAGSEPPVNDQEYGGRPPAAPNEVGTGAPTTKLPTDIVVIVTWTATSRVNPFEAVSLFRSVTCAEIGNDPALVGVPVIAPEFTSTLSPSGKPVTAH